VVEAVQTCLGDVQHREPHIQRFVKYNSCLVELNTHEILSKNSPGVEIWFGEVRFCTVPETKATDNIEAQVINRNLEWYETYRPSNLVRSLMSRRVSERRRAQLDAEFNDFVFSNSKPGGGGSVGSASQNGSSSLSKILSR